MPNFYLFGGPNGAGKTTAALQILPSLGCETFINADMIAAGLSPLNVDAAALKAGAIMMKELRQLAKQGVDFGTESTLAARAYAPLIDEWKSMGYRFHLFFVWLPSSEAAIDRVAARVRAGGHDIPVDTIRRRYEKGLVNFRETYLPRADSFTVLDNSGLQYRIVGWSDGVETEVQIPDVWEEVVHG